MASAKVLIVEDEILIARKIESTLRQLGYEVTGIAQDADMALQKATDTQPDLILMDIVIQGEMDGVAAAEQIRDRLHIPRRLPDCLRRRKHLRACQTYPTVWLSAQTVQPKRTADCRGASPAAASNRG